MSTGKQYHSSQCCNLITNQSWLSWLNSVYHAFYRLDCLTSAVFFQQDGWRWQPEQLSYFNGVGWTAILSRSTTSTKTETQPSADLHVIIISPPLLDRCLCWALQCWSIPTCPSTAPLWTTFYYLLGHQRLFLRRPTKSHLFQYGTWGESSCLLWKYTG